MCKNNTSKMILFYTKLFIINYVYAINIRLNKVVVFNVFESLLSG